MKLKLPKPQTKANRARTEQTSTIEKMLLDTSVDIEHRKQLLQQLVQGGHPELDELFAKILNAAAAAEGESLALRKAEEYAELIRLMQQGPLRVGTFVDKVEMNGFGRRAEVLFSDGTAALCMLPDDALARALHCGDRVLIEAQGHAVLFRAPGRADTGELARLERRVDRERIEVTVRDQGRFVFQCGADLADQLDQEELVPGDNVLVCPQRHFAFEGMRADGHRAGYRYLVPGGVPEAAITEKIASPKPFIEDYAEHVRLELVDPSLLRRYGLPRSKQAFLWGPTGTGKSLSIRVLHRRMYEVMSEVTGVPVDDLPRRVLRLRPASYLSEWLGRSDKNLDRFFDECEQLADETFVGPDGREWQLPVLVIFEEIDSLGRTRGSDGIHDRIQTTFLERLDPTTQELGSKLILMLFTSNVPGLVDPAFLRRVGGDVFYFGRLDRRSFRAVAQKHIGDRPIRREGRETHEVARRRTIDELESWLYAPNGEDQGQVEITLVGSTQPKVMHRPDFLTGAIVERAVHQAATEACRAARLGADRGIDARLLKIAFRDHVTAIVEQLDAHNVRNYLALPEERRVATVRRVPQPALLAAELERTAS